MKGVRRIACLSAVLWPVGVGLADEPPAQAIALTAAGGWNLPSRQPWAGLELSFRHDGTRGTRFHGGVRGGWAFFENRPHVDLDAGFMTVLPTERLIRLGVAAGAQMSIAPFDVPFGVAGDPDGYGRFAILPYGYLQTELGWQRPEATKGPAAWSLGVRVGATGAAGTVACDADPEEDCIGPVAAFVGGIVGRIRFHEGAWIEAVAGPSATLSVGYAFPIRRRATVPADPEETARTEDPEPHASEDPGVAIGVGEADTADSDLAVDTDPSDPSEDTDPSQDTDSSDDTDPAVDPLEAEDTDANGQEAPPAEEAPSPEEAPAPDLYDGFLD